MAEPTPIEERDPGAPIARDQVDPELVKLGRGRPTIGVITAAGIVALCLVYLLRLGPDRRFAGSDSTPAPAGVADVLAGKVELDRLIALPAEPIVSQAIRATKAAGSLGFRLAPVRSTGDRLWVVLPGDGWEAATTSAYVGRLRRLDALSFGAAAREYAAAHPRAGFASASAVRAGFSTGTVTTVAGDPVTLTDRDRIAIDVVDPNAATIAAAFNERLPDPATWARALSAAGIPVTTTGTPDEALRQIRFGVALPVSTTTTKLEAAGLLATRVEPVTRHFDTTWGVLRASPPAGLQVGSATLPDSELELIGLYVLRGIPDDAYALVTGELPEDYWYVMPITIALAAILLVFGWALVRAIRRDLVSARAA